MAEFLVTGRQVCPTGAYSKINHILPQSIRLPVLELWTPVISLICLITALVLIWSLLSPKAQLFFCTSKRELPMEYSMIKKPEEVIRGVRAKWFSFVLCLISLAITAVLFWINFTKQFWFPISGIHHKDYAFIKATPNNIINGVLFAAKGYEILVVICLGAMTLDVYKRHLVKEGVPYGLLTGAYRVSDIEFILNPRFWRSAPRAILLAATLVISVVLGTLAGPAAAILIVPKLGLYSVPDAFSQISLPLYTTSSPWQAWPQLLNSTASNPALGCQALQGAFVPECPGGGFSNIYGWISGWSFSGLTNNITFPDPSGQVSRRLDMFSNNDRGTFLSTPTALTVAALGQFKSYLKGENVGKISDTEFYKLSLTGSLNYQPLVNAKCRVWNNQTYDFDNALALGYPYEELNCFTDDTCVQMRERMKNMWPVNDGVWKDSRPSAAFYIGNAGNRTSDGSYLSSLIFSGSSPYIDQDNNHGLRVIACSYMAHWIPTHFWANSTDSESIVTNLTDLSIFTNEKTWKEEHPEAVVGRTIAFDSTYLPYLALGDYAAGVGNNSAVSKASIDSLRYLFQPLQTVDKSPYFIPGRFESSPDAGDRVVEKYMEKITGAMVTDAIARTNASANVIVAQKPQADGTTSLLYLGLRGKDTRREMVMFPNGTYRTVNDEWRVYTGTPQEFISRWKNTTVNFNLEVQRYGYGYGLTSAPLIFAYVAIGLYVVAIITYWVITLIFRANTIAAVDDLQDLLALAWRSHSPPELERNGVNNMDRSLCKDTVAIRATSDDMLALVLNKGRQESPDEQAPEGKTTELLKKRKYW